MPLFSRFKNKGAQTPSKSKTQQGVGNGGPVVPQKPRYETSWNSKSVVLEEVVELIHACTAEMKSRAEALDSPFLLLPFRPNTDASGARSFIRNFYKGNAEGSHNYRGAGLQQELRLTDPAVLCSIMKWCWSRMPGGVVTWPVYEGFQIGERESNMARNAFDTFIPIGAGSGARKSIIFDFYDLLAAVAAHGKLNGLGGRKVSRLAGWWAFDHSDDGKGFEGGYKSWMSAADASSHLFFAYLRSLSPDADGSMTLIDRIPRSLQALVASTEYPPERPALLQRSTPRVVMLVDAVSPTPFALLRRAKHFEFRDSDKLLREYSEFEDPLDALTDECKRVLYAISSINSAAALSRHGQVAITGQESWSAFQNLGFSDLDQKTLHATSSGINGKSSPESQGLRAGPRLQNGDSARPTTPSWADFLSSGFPDDGSAKSPTTLSLPYDKVLPPIGSRAQTPAYSQLGEDDRLAPGELAAVTNVDLDDAFWWVWMTSLAGEEPSERKAVFGRCALVETNIMNGKWVIMEEQLKGASPDPADGAYIVPKKSIFGFTKRGRNKKARGEKTTQARPETLARAVSATPSKSSLAPDQHSQIRAAAAALTRQQSENDAASTSRRGRHEDAASVKTSSMLTMGMMNEASPAMQWAKAYDKHTIRAHYLGDSFAGKGMSRENLVRKTSSVNIDGDGASNAVSPAPVLAPEGSAFPFDHAQNRDLPAVPQEPHTNAGAEKLQPVVRSEPVHEAAATRQAVPVATPVIALPAEEGDREDDDEDDAAPAPSVPSGQTAQPSALDKEIAVGTPARVGRVERKPVPHADNLPEHPAFRGHSVDEAAQTPSVPLEPQTPKSPTNSAAIAAHRAMTSTQSTSPESATSDRSKFKKQSGGAGLKKFFGRKKDNPNRNSLEAPPGMNAASLAPPSETNLGRRLSLMRKRPASKPVNTPASQAAQAALAKPAPPASNEPTVSGSRGQFDPPSPEMSRVDTRSDAYAEEEFSRFDQGPMEDSPAVSPPESVEKDLSTPVQQQHFNTQIASRIAPEQHEPEPSFHSPMERTETFDDDAQSETTMEEQQPRAIEPTVDRWAQIRDNAAKRAARASEEHSMQSRTKSSARETDDGETSGEETIESRVARIKARVAELTGNIDNGRTQTAKV